MIHLKKTLLTLVALFAMTTGAWADTTVTWTANDLSNPSGTSFTKDGITLTVESTDNCRVENTKLYIWGPTFTTTSGNITKIVVTADSFAFPDQNWTYDGNTATWTGNASSVSCSGYFNDVSQIVFTIEGAAPAGTALTPDETRKVWTLEKMPASNVELQVEYYPAMLTLAASPADGGKVELDAAAAPVEWTPETWTNVSTTGQHGDLTSGDITLTATGGWLTKQEDGNLSLYSADNEYYHHTLTFSTTGDGFTRIELTMTSDASNHNPHITPADGWTFSGKSAVWEGEATKSLVCQNCTTTVSKITFYRGSGLPVGVEKDETGNIYVKKDVTVKVKATPEEGYEFASWADDATITTAEREITMGDDDLTVTANFTAKPYDVTLTAKNDFTIEAGKATVTVDGTAATPAEGKISGVTKGQKVAITAATGYKFRSATANKGGAAAGKTYTELKGGEVLHLGDKIEVPEADKYWYPNEEVLQKGKTYEVVRVNISGNDFEPTVTESETGAYYALHEVGTNSYKFVTGSDSYRLKVTATSDGIAVADNGLTGTGYHKYIFSVHEPAGN